MQGHSTTTTFAGTEVLNTASFPCDFRFSKRDLFWLTLVVGILLAWWFSHREPAVQTPPTLKIFNLVNADAKTMSETMQKLYSWNPEIRIVADAPRNVIIVSGPSQQQQEIEAILLKLDEAAAK